MAVPAAQVSFLVFFGSQHPCTLPVFFFVVVVFSMLPNLFLSLQVTQKSFCIFLSLPKSAVVSLHKKSDKVWTLMSLR